MIDDHETGFLVNPSSHREIFSLLYLLASRPTLSVKTGLKARQKVKASYATKALASRYIKLDANVYKRCS